MSKINNPYPGVNAHLNSRLLQRDGGWEMFHAAHIIQLQQVLDELLPDNYYAAPEKSLQVTAIDNDRPMGRTTPDIGVYRTGADDAQQRVSENVTAPTAVLPIDDTMVYDVPDPGAVTIYRLDGGQLPGRLVTRIELLSPGNKPGGGHYTRYLQRRHETLNSGINLVEIDYLHTTHPTVPSIASYPRKEAGATPYYVLVIDPRPNLTEGKMHLYAVAVDMFLPRLTTPLADSDRVILDLQYAYNRTIDSGRVFRMLADTTKPLVAPETYHQTDRERIDALLVQS